MPATLKPRVLSRGPAREERLMWKLVGTGSRRGDAPASRAADVLRRPLLWCGFALALALTGPRGRRAALRGAGCSAAGSLIHMPIKRAFDRPRPRFSRLIGRGAPTSTAFPSGHTASDLSFLFGASQEIPPLAVPLSIATLGSHWSLLRSRRHYPSDIVAGGAIALAVNVAARLLWPPGDSGRSRSQDASSSALSACTR